jgi:hypothetical protein
MPAFEPGWDASLTSAAAYTDARTSFCWSLLVSFSRCSATAFLAHRRGLYIGALTFPLAPV